MRECPEDPYGGSPHQPDFGARHRSYRCSLPGLTGFTTSRREGADTDCHGKELADRVGFEPTNTVRCYLISKQAPSTARPPVRNPMLRAPTDFTGAHHSNLLLRLLRFRGWALRAVGLANGGGVSRQGSSLPRMRSGVLSGGTFSALRVSGASSPAGACSGGISWPRRSPCSSGCSWHLAALATGQAGCARTAEQDNSGNSHRRCDLL